MKIYISGPMSNYPELNFPTFERVAKRLRDLGYEVISPHEIEQPVKTWESCMKEDIKQLMDCDTVATLSGWENSKGACIEVQLAKSLGMEVYEAHKLLGMEVSL